MKKTKILVVDDDDGVLIVIKKICPDYEVTTEKSPLKALELIKKEKFDIFIISYQLSHMTGIELLEEIKQECEENQYICIFCTPYGTIHLFKEEICQGLFSFYIEKPFEIDVFKEIVRKATLFLNRKRQFAALQVSNN
jgi:DNA-binding NtrC family response regulator